MLKQILNVYNLSREICNFHFMKLYVNVWTSVIYPLAMDRKCNCNLRICDMFSEAGEEQMTRIL